MWTLIFKIQRVIIQIQKSEIILLRNCYNIGIGYIQKMYVYNVNLFVQTVNLTKKKHRTNWPWWRCVLLALICSVKLFLMTITFNFLEIVCESNVVIRFPATI